MSYKDPELDKIKKHEYYLKNREKIIQRTAEWRKNNPGKRNAVESKRNAVRVRTDPDFREYRKQKSRDHHSRHKALILELANYHAGTECGKARKQAYYAVKKGILVRPTACSKCACTSHKIQAHHNDYTKPLDVVWLCVFCHGEIHKLHNYNTNLVTLEEILTW